jgi:predicted ferric reductase
MNERQKHIVLWILIVATTLPFFFLVHKPVFGLEVSSLRSLALYLSAAFGYIGISLLIWELILGTRAISGLYFRDLASKLALHRWLGTYGMLLIFLHPLLIVYSYGESLAYSILPDVRNTFEIHVTYGRLALIALALIWITSAVARGKIAYRPWKYIHYLSYPALLLSLLHVPATGSSFPERGIQFFWLSFCVVVLVCTVLRLSQFFGYSKLAYRITGTELLNDEIIMLKLSPVGAAVEISMGQYIYLQSRTYGEEHPFTVLDHNPQMGEILIAFKIFGRFTQGLAKMPEGDVLMLDGPYGVFTAERFISPMESAVYIAGGIGVTPFVRHALSNPETNQFLFWANQSRKASVFRDILRERLGGRFIEVYSREIINEVGVESGHLDQTMLAKYLSNPSQYQYFLCGPQGMMNGVEEALRKLEVPASKIHMEKFGF